MSISKLQKIILDFGDVRYDFTIKLIIETIIEAFEILLNATTHTIVNHNRFNILYLQQLSQPIKIASNFQYQVRIYFRRLFTMGE